MQHFGRIFLNGLGMIVPTALLIYLVIWMIRATESLFSPWAAKMLPQSMHFAGMGLILGVVFVFLVGLGLRFWIVVKLKELFDALIERIPLVKSIYSSINDFMGFFTSMKDAENKKMVLVTLPESGIKLIGFVTQEDLSHIDGTEEDEVGVYLQMSYQMGGYLVFVPRKCLTPLTMGVEEGLRMVMTAGISAGKPKPKA